MSEGSHSKPNYAAIFIALFLLTVSEIFAANLPMPRTATILILVAFALAKATLVAMFYMHLRFEKVLLAVIAVAPLLFSLILVLGIGFDIWSVAP